MVSVGVVSCSVVLWGLRARRGGLRCCFCVVGWFWGLCWGWGWWRRWVVRRWVWWGSCVVVRLVLCSVSLVCFCSWVLISFCCGCLVVRRLWSVSRSVLSWWGFGLFICIVILGFIGILLCCCLWWEILLLF